MTGVDPERSRESSQRSCLCRQGCETRMVGRHAHTFGTAASVETIADGRPCWRRASGIQPLFHDSSVVRIAGKPTPVLVVLGDSWPLSQSIYLHNWESQGGDNSTPPHRSVSAASSIPYPSVSTCPARRLQLASRKNFADGALRCLPK